MNRCSVNQSLIIDLLKDLQYFYMSKHLMLSKIYQKLHSYLQLIVNTVLSMCICIFEHIFV